MCGSEGIDVADLWILAEEEGGVGRDDSPRARYPRSGFGLVDLGFSPSDDDLWERGRYTFDFHLFRFLIPFEVFSAV